MKINSFAYGVLAPILFGIGAFFLVIGPYALDPNNIAWLTTGDDIAQHYLGAVFYRYGPWTMPVGLNPNFGIEISSSIVFSDSIPIMAFILKTFSSWLGEPFQYFGIWILICFLLQAVLAWMLIGLFCKDNLTRIFGAGLFVFSPPMLYRLGAHTSLASHFLILAALYLVLRQENKHRIFLWMLILGLSSLTAFYLFVMVMGLWIANILDKSIISKLLSIKQVIVEICIIFSILFFLFWQAGYFAIEPASSVEWGFGFFRMNLLAIFNPMGWSYLIDSLYLNPNTYEYEGFNYLGLGVIGLLLLVLWKKGLPTKLIITGCQNYLFFCICLLGFTLFSISQNIGIGPVNLNLEIPDSLHTTASVLRASGRLFWPVWYVIVLVIIRTALSSFSQREALGILILVLVIQVADTSIKWLPIRHQFMANKSNQFQSPLTNIFWKGVPEHYQQIIRRPIEGWPPDWQILASYAGANRMATDSVYLARVNYKKLQPLNIAFLNAIENENLDSHSLYVVSNTLAVPILEKINKDRDLFARIDNQNVLAPGWLKCADCNLVDTNLYITKLAPRFFKGEKITFSSAFPKNDLVLTYGWWGWPEDWGIWAVGNDAIMNLLIPSDNPNKLIVYVRAFVSPTHPMQNLELFVNDVLINKYSFNLAEHNRIEFPISAEMKKQGYLSIRFHFLNPIQPIAIGLGNDSRALAVGLETAQFE